MPMLKVWLKEFSQFYRPRHVPRLAECVGGLYLSANDFVFIGLVECQTIEYALA